MASSITIKQVRAFLAAADQGSFSKAAEAIFLSQPAFSRSIAELEADLGVTLFERTGKRVKLSPSGIGFIPAARRLIQSYEDTVKPHAAIKRQAGNCLTFVLGPTC